MADLYETSVPDSSHMACAISNTYVPSRNGIPQGQYCSRYNEPWAPSHATNYGKWRQSNRYTISRSYSHAVDFAALVAYWEAREADAGASAPGTPASAGSAAGGPPSGVSAPGAPAATRCSSVWRAGGSFTGFERSRLLVQRPKRPSRKSHCSLSPVVHGLWPFVITKRERIFTSSGPRLFTSCRAFI